MTATLPALVAPTEPGIYDGIPDTVYHADRGSLSSSGARKLLAPSCPALFKFDQDAGQTHKRVFDFGHAAHTKVLGYGADVVAVKADSWRTKAAQEARDAAYTDGKTPLLEHEVATVDSMADALKAHPLAAALFADGAPEQSFYWRDEETGVMLRSRPDWLPNPNGGRLIITDYKTAITSEPGAFGKTAATLGYHQQAAWYIDGAIALGLHGAPAFLFVVQAKSAPYLVSVVELDRDAIDLGRRLNRKAIRTYARCVETSVWPGWGDDVTLTSLPTWAHYQQEEILNV